MEETFFDGYRAEQAGGSPLRFLVVEIPALVGQGVYERFRGGGRHLSLAGTADDLRFAARALVKQPAFALGAIAMLVLGIGANTAAFSMATGMSRIVDRFEEPDELVFLWGVEQGGWDRAPVPVEDFLAWRQQAGAFQDMGVYAHTYRYLTGSGDPVRLRVAQTSANLLPMLGLDAEVGRLYGPGDEALSAPPVAVLTHRLWQERYGGETSVVGTTILLNEVPHTVIGVLPAKVDFELLWRNVTAFAPLSLDLGAAGQADMRVSVIGRLAGGVTVDQARTQLTAITARRTDARAEGDAGIGVSVEPFP